MSPAKRPCLTCGKPSSGSYCAEHGRRPSRQWRGYGNDWYRAVRAAIAAQPWCSKCGATEDLTGDHVLAVARGGVSDASNIQVLCRSCNSSKGKG
jgi:5-methylcytosine-specific restriction enzyme A